MTRYFFIVIFILISIQLKAQLSESIRVEESDLSFSRMEEFDCVTWNKSSEFVERINAPKLPVIIESFVIPFGAQVANIDVVVKEKNLLDRSLLILPVDPPISIRNDFATLSLNLDSTIYNSSLAYPTENVKIISDTYEHGYHVVTVEICPFEYIPLNKALSLLDLAFTINYIQTRGVTEYPQYQSSKSANRAYNFVYSKVKNKQDINRFSNQRTGVVSNESLNMNERNLSVSDATVNIIPEYLIVTNNELKTTFQRLANWKTKKGVPSVVMTIEEVQAQNEGCDLAEKIRNYLKKCRQEWGDDFFVLLGGDTNIIPPRMATNGPDRDDYRYNKYKNDSTIRAQDLYYTALDGNWNMNNNHIYNEYYQFLNPNTGKDVIINIDQADYGRDIYLGRAPVKNTSEAENFVNKVLLYEKANANIDYSYILNSLNIDAFIIKDENTGFLSDDARSSIYGYYSSYPQLHRWFLFDHYNCTCNKHSAYTGASHGEELNKNNFMAALQNGGNSGYNHFHLVYHMDHSSPRGMGASSLDKNEAIHNTDVDQLTNGNYLQIVLSSGCEPATFNEDCIAEHFINNPNGGAVAYMGNADRGWDNEYRQLDRLLKALYSNESIYHNLGYVFQATIGSRNSDNCRLTLLGDPEMPVWTAVPQTLNVSVTPNTITNGENTISIQINNLPANQEALVCLMKEGEGYSTLTINDRAVHSFTFTPYTSGVVDVTVTTNNFRPFETTIPVSVSPKAVLHISDLVFDDDKTGGSNGNNDKQLDAGETVELSVALKNEGSTVSDVVTGKLTCNSSEISMINDVVSFGKINAGSNQVSGTKFVFTIDKNCREHLKSAQDPIEFTLKIQNGTNFVNEKFLVDVFAPEIEIGNQKVTWTSNGNKTVEAGETVKMNIDLMNMGKAVATGVKAVLISNNAQISCSSTPIVYPAIPFAETKSNTIAFQFQTASNYTGGLNLTLQLSNEYGKTWSFPVNPLLRPAVIDVSTINTLSYSSSINVYWTPVSNVVGYNIYRSNNGENGVYQKLNKFPLTAAYYLDDNLAKLATYYYKISTISSNGNESSWSPAYRTWTSYPVVSPFPRRISTGAYSSVSSPNIADVDNDGKQEIFWIYEDRYETRTSYLMGFRPTGEELFDIDGNVTTVSGFAKTPTMLTGQVAFGDLAGNGEQNIVVSTWDDLYRDKNAVRCYSPFDKDGDHKPDLLWEKKIPYSMFQSPVIANLDGSSDGTMEVIIKSHQTSDIFILDHNGNELRRLNPNVADENDHNYSALTVADLDNDGQMEIIASYDSLGIYIWRQDGTPFTTNPFWGAGILRLASAPVVCDLNEDGKKEILFSQRQMAESHIFAISLEGDKTVAGWDGSQTIPYTVNVVGSTLDHTLSVGDINNDGHLEVVILGHEMVKAWKHTGDFLFSKPINGLFPQENYAANIDAPVLADVDGDAIPDVVFCCKNFIYALHNDGSDIVGFPIISDEGFLVAPCVADIDNDGKNELIAGNEKDLYVWKTEGIPTAIEWGVYRGNPQNTGEYFPTVCKPMLINANETWDGESPCGNVVLQSGRLVVPGDKTMTLNNTSSIIVRSGATLEVDGGSILNARLVVQKGGTVVVKNNGLIKLRSGAGFEMENGAVLDLPCGAIDVP